MKGKKPISCKGKGLQSGIVHVCIPHYPGLLSCSRVDEKKIYVVDLFHFKTGVFCFSGFLNLELCPVKLDSTEIHSKSH